MLSNERRDGAAFWRRFRGRRRSGEGQLLFLVAALAQARGGRRGGARAAPLAEGPGALHGARRAAGRARSDARETVDRRGAEAARHRRGLVLGAEGEVAGSRTRESTRRDATGRWRGWACRLRGQFLFLLHMLAHARERAEGGSRVAIIMNGSRLSPATRAAARARSAASGTAARAGPQACAPPTSTPSSGGR